MYEQQTFQEILNRMLERVPNNIDKREGSIIYDALAPVAMELAEMYADLDVTLNLSFADTATGEYLTRRAEEVGVTRKPATKARRRGLFYDSEDAPIDVPLESRFRIDNVVFRTIERKGTGDYVLECEALGSIGNNPLGDLLPIQHINGLSRAVIEDILERGTEEEDDESLRARYFDSLRGQAFGGNIADYRQKTMAIEGVTAVKVYPVWDGPGTVRLVILGADYLPADVGLVERVQEDVDPYPTGQGYGTAPIGHTVTVASAVGVNIGVETSLLLDDGYTPSTILPDVESKLGEYLADIRKDWHNSNSIIVRIALIDARILDIPGVLDVTNTKINGVASNVTLADNEVPIKGQVVIHG